MPVNPGPCPKESTKLPTIDTSAGGQFRCKNQSSTLEQFNVTLPRCARVHRLHLCHVFNSGAVVVRDCPKRNEVVHRGDDDLVVKRLQKRCPKLAWQALDQLAELLGRDPKKQLPVAIFRGEVVFSSAEIVRLFIELDFDGGQTGGLG